MSEIKLGLCNPPEPIYLYVGQGELDGEAYLWYKFNIDNQATIPVRQRGLIGYIQELRLTQKEYRGKDNLKLDLVISADEPYVIRTGVETNFAKTLLLVLETIEDFSKPYLIAVSAGEENVVFCRVYDAQTKQRIKAEWNAQADWAGIIELVQQRLLEKLILHEATLVQQKLSQNKHELSIVPVPEPWRNWRTPNDAINWAQSQLPAHSIEFLSTEFAKLEVGNGKKAPAWVRRVEDLKKEF